ncbi:MAG: iron ABC transporter permease, partial [Mesorhizobium sp.]
MATGAAAIAALALPSIAYGSTVIALIDVIAALGQAAGLDGDLVPGSVGNIPVAKIIVDLRLPRTIMAICVGVGLGVIGALLQT